jgi:hypothetical protein
MMGGAAWTGMGRRAFCRNPFGPTILAGHLRSSDGLNLIRDILEQNPMNSIT